MIKCEVASASQIGGRTENQDCYKYTDTSLGLLAVVCDGMGGANGGKMAAELAVSKIFEEVSASPKANPKEVIREAILKANDAIFRESRNKPGLFGMGTTVTALLINENYAICFHVGDSRIYQFRKGNILFRTFDHSKVFELVRLGKLTEEEARLSPASNIITRVLGIRPEVKISCSDELTYKKEDRFLLCTDGIWGVVPETELTQMVSLEKPIEEVVKHLTTYIDQLGIEEGGMHDNLTAILIEM
jgi:serine/threonine protein phosphatase PrpC